MGEKYLMYRLDFKWHRDTDKGTALYPTWEKASKEQFVLANGGYEVSEVQPVYVVPKENKHD